jgi:hypothetical protein
VSMTPLEFRATLQQEQDSLDRPLAMAASAE